MSALDRNNDLLEDIAVSALANQRQRGDELQKWRQANPGLAQNCRHAAESLARVQAEFLQNLTREVEENSEAMEEGEFVIQRIRRSVRTETRTSQWCLADAFSVKPGWWRKPRDTTDALLLRMPSVLVKQLFSLVLALQRASTLDFSSFGPYLTWCAQYARDSCPFNARPRSVTFTTLFRMDKVNGNG